MSSSRSFRKLGPAIDGGGGGGNDADDVDWGFENIVDNNLSDDDGRSQTLVDCFGALLYPVALLVAESCVTFRNDCLSVAVLNSFDP